MPRSCTAGLGWAALQSPCAGQNASIAGRQQRCKQANCCAACAASDRAPTGCMAGSKEAGHFGSQINIHLPRETVLCSRLLSGQAAAGMLYMQRYVRAAQAYSRKGRV